MFILIVDTTSTSSSSSSNVVKREAATKPCDVYISSRFNEHGPTEERKKLVQNLEKFGVKVTAIDSETSYNETIEATICRDITTAKLVILMVTDDYASAETLPSSHIDTKSTATATTDAAITIPTQSSTSINNRITTREELEFVIETQRPFFLLKLCRVMPPTTAKLPLTSAYASWSMGRQAPSGLTETLLKKIDNRS